MRKFQAGNKVLILLPIPGQPLQAQYCGPYTIDKKVGDLDYVVNTPGWRKTKRLCHINMLTLYHRREHTEETGPCGIVTILPTEEAAETASSEERVV